MYFRLTGCKPVELKNRCVTRKRVYESVGANSFAQRRMYNLMRKKQNPAVCAAQMCESIRTYRLFATDMGLLVNYTTHGRQARKKNRLHFRRRINQVSLKNFRFTRAISFLTGDISSQNVTIQTSGRASSGKMHGPVPSLRNMQSDEKKGCSFSRHLRIFSSRAGFKPRRKIKSRWLITKSDCIFLQQIPPQFWIQRVIKSFDLS